MAFKRAAAADSLWMNEMMAVLLDGIKVLLVNVDGRISAFEDRCMHKGYPLSQGMLEGAELVCAAHLWRYDACTGKGINPAAGGLRRFPVELVDGGIFVDLESGENG